MKSSYTLTFLAAFYAIGAWSRPLHPSDSLSPRMTMYYDKDVADEVDPGTEDVSKRMTMYYDKDVADEVDPETDEVTKRMTMYYDKDVADEVDPEAETAEKA